MRSAIFLLLGGVLSLIFTTPVYAIGLSPPEADIGYIPVGSVQTVAATISRAVDDPSGDLTITVSARKSAAKFFHGESSFVIPKGVHEVTYLYNIIPEYADTANQGLYVTFLLQATANTDGNVGVGVISGVTQVSNFTTDVIAGSVSSGTSSKGVSSEPEEDVADEPMPSESEPSASEEAEPPLDAAIPEPSASEEAESPLDAKAIGQTDMNMPMNEKSLEKLTIQSSTYNTGGQFTHGDHIMFSWQSPGQSEKTIFAFLLTRDPSVGADDLIFQTQNPSVYFGGLNDGIYYFHVMNTLDPKKTIITKMIRVDNTPPSVELSIASRKRARIFPREKVASLAVADALAGIRRIIVTVDGALARLSEMEIDLQDLEFGSHRIIVNAVDNAGNKRETKFAIQILPRYPIAETIKQILNFPRKIFSLVASGLNS